MKMSSNWKKKTMRMKKSCCYKTMRKNLSRMKNSKKSWTMKTSCCNSKTMMSWKRKTSCKRKSMRMRTILPMMNCKMKKMKNN